MAELIIRQAALRDLERIVRRIAAEDPGAAVRFRQDVFHRIGLLRVAPQSAQPRAEFGVDIRTIPIGSYVVFLQVRLPQVTVLRIVHGARDLPRIVKP
jgi:toxin ParE1/3/4